MQIQNSKYLRFQYGKSQISLKPAVQAMIDGVAGKFLPLALGIMQWKVQQNQAFH
jgi:hypothetical protein